MQKYGRIWKNMLGNARIRNNMQQYVTRSNNTQEYPRKYNRRQECEKAKIPNNTHAKSPSDMDTRWQYAYFPHVQHSTMLPFWA